MKNANDLAEWVKRQTGHRGPIDDDTSVQKDLGVYGDDMHELMAAYGERYKVDMATYLWYFHTREEGWNIGALFVRPPNRRVPRIPITIGMLRKFADSGEWSVDCPQHELPERRYDTLINLIFAAFLVLGIVALLAWKYLG
jgi:hypothetical protein